MAEALPERERAAMSRPLWRAAFLAALAAEDGKVAPASVRAGVSRRQVYRLRLSDPTFREDMDAVLDVVRAALTEQCACSPENLRRAAARLGLGLVSLRHTSRL